MLSSRACSLPNARILRRIVSSQEIASRKASSAKLNEKLWWPLLVLVCLRYLDAESKAYCRQSLFGTSLTIADGVFTPAVSVTSAVSGIAIAKPSVGDDVIPISIVSGCYYFILVPRYLQVSGFLSGFVPCPVPRDIAACIHICTRQILRLSSFTLWITAYFK